MLSLSVFVENAGPLLEFALKWDLLRLLSGLMYVLFCAGLFSLGTKYHESITKGESEVGQFPEGYFTMLAIQLLPLTISGFVLHDVYIAGTRAVTLGVVLLVYAMVKSKNEGTKFGVGTFNTPYFHRWFTIWIGVVILGSLLWSENPTFQEIVRAYENWIVWLSDAVMIVFVWRGQWTVAKSLFRHFVAGNYTVKRFKLQIVRFFGFFLQAIHYYFSPTTATPINLPVVGSLDPIFLQGAIGTVGVGMVLLWALFGLLFGTSARREHKLEEKFARAIS